MTFDIKEDLFWTSPGTDGGAADPLGLDSLREEVSGDLVPFLTGRTGSPEEAYWCLVFLRWSQSRNKSSIVEEFLRWERRLKLVWARSRSSGTPLGPRSFSGKERAEEQAKETVPEERYRQLLANQRSQGMLGEYRVMLEKLGLISGVELDRESTECNWTSGAGDPPDQGKTWSSWRRAFTRARRGCPRFRELLRNSLRTKMPKLARGLARAGWSLDRRWDRAAGAMGSLANTARFAHRFCDWADLVRANFDRLAKGEQSPRSLRWPGRLAVPPGYLSGANGARWRRAIQFSRTGAGERLAVLVRWHELEFRERGHGPEELWLECGGDARRPVAHPYNCARSARETGSDCRWWNAVRMVGPDAR